MTSQGVQNYGDLKSLMATYMNRSDQTTNIPGYLKVAQNQLAIDLRVPEMITDGSITESDRVSGGKYNLPSDFLSVRVITGTDEDGNTKSIRSVGIDEIYDYLTSGWPRVYTVWDNVLLIRGTPATDTSFGIIYYARPTELTSDSDTSSLLTRHYKAYLYAGLVEWFNVSKSYDDRDQMAQQYQNYVIAANAAAKNARQQPTVRPAFDFGNTFRGTF